MKHTGKARKAALKLSLIALVAVVILLGMGVVATLFAAAIYVLIPVLFVLWILFAFFTLYFFRDPDASVPVGANLVVSPAHGKVDVIDTTTEPRFMKGECRRVSIFLSVIDIHVQQAPVGGKVAF